MIGFRIIQAAAGSAGGGAGSRIAITAKSIVFDIEDNWNSLDYLGVRAVEFYLSGNLINTDDRSFSAYSTSVISDGWLPRYAFLTSLPKTSDAYQASWLSSDPFRQRLIVIFDDEITFDEIRVNNVFHAGTESHTDRGAKTVQITASTDEITSTIYAEEIENSTDLGTSEWSMHVEEDIEDPQTVWSAG